MNDRERTPHRSQHSAAELKRRLLLEAVTVTNKFSSRLVRLAPPRSLPDLTTCSIARLLYLHQKGAWRTGKVYAAVLTDSKSHHSCTR